MSDLEGVGISFEDKETGSILRLGTKTQIDSDVDIELPSKTSVLVSEETIDEIKNSLRNGTFVVKEAEGVKNLNIGKLALNNLGNLDIDNIPRRVLTAFGGGSAGGVGVSTTLIDTVLYKKSGFGKNVPMDTSGRMELIAGENEDNFRKLIIRYVGDKAVNNSPFSIYVNGDLIHENGTVTHEPNSIERQLELLDSRVYDQELELGKGVTLGESDVYATNSVSSLWNRLYITTWSSVVGGAYLMKPDSYFDITVDSTVRLFTYSSFDVNRCTVLMEDLDTGEEYLFDGGVVNKWFYRGVIKPGRYRVKNSGDTPLWNEWFFQVLNPTGKIIVPLDTREVTIDTSGEGLGAIWYEVYTGKDVNGFITLFNIVYDIITKTGKRTDESDRFKELMKQNGLI